MIENKKIQYKLGEDGTAKSFILEVTWTDEYPEELPEISLDAFYNKHLIPTVKEQILEFAKSEAEQYLGIKVDILYSNCSHITFELNWVFILNFGSFFLLLRLQNTFSF